MSVTLHAEHGHAEAPGTDGWHHVVPTGRVRLILDGPRDQMLALQDELKLRDRADLVVMKTFHDGPGEGSCATCLRSSVG